MNELHLPWLEMSVLLPLLGSLWVSRLRRSQTAHWHALVIAGLTLGCAFGAWRDFAALGTFEAHDRWHLFETFVHTDDFVIDELSAPLIPLSALLYFLTILSTLKTKAQRFSFSSALFSESLLLATMSCRHSWTVVVLLSLGTIPPYLELLRRHKPTRVYALHMGAFILSLAAGQFLIDWEGARSPHSLTAILLLSGAVLLRCGIVPVHCWMTDLFEHATFGTSLLFVTPMVGAYAAMRLVLPIAPDWVLRGIALVSLITAVYAAGMTLVQKEARRFFCYLFLSNSSLILVGLEIGTPVALTGALCVWLSVALAVGGFGLTLRSVEARVGRLSLATFHGLFERMPRLGAFFLLTGLASIGFPGTIGFIAVELLVDGVVELSPYMGAAVVIASALNGLAILMAYSRIFTGSTHATTIDLRIRPWERIAVLVLAALILGGGLIPQPGVSSRYHAAMELMGTRERRGLHDENEDPHHDEDHHHNDHHHESGESGEHHASVRESRLIGSEH